MLCYGVLLVSFLFSLVVCLPRQESDVAKTIVSQEVDSEDDKSEGKKKELAQLLKKDILTRLVDDDTGKVLPGQAIPGAIGVPHLPIKDKNFARRMAETQWHQQQSRSRNLKSFQDYKRAMHNRNTINDNRHDRKEMKIPRHPH